MLVNAVTSAATALGLIAFPGLVADLFQAGSAQPFVEVGIFLLVFSAKVLYEALKNPIRRGHVQFIITLDVLWVVASIVLIEFQFFNLSLIGYVLTGAVAMWVGAMAVLQWRGLKAADARRTA